MLEDVTLSTIDRKYLSDNWKNVIDTTANTLMNDWFDKVKSKLKEMMPKIQLVKDELSKREELNQEELKNILSV